MNEEPIECAAATFPLHTRFARLVGPSVAVAAILSLAVLFAPRQVGAQDSADGAALYTQHCAACHQANGEGIVGTFPPLLANPAAADTAYVTDVIENGKSGPLEVLGASYDTEMPAVSTLADADIPVVVEFVSNLASQGATDSTSDPEPDAAPIVGDIDRGHDLFTGSNRFDNGGAACAACHTAGSVGNLGGSALGPDLTGSFSSLGGEAGLSAWLSNPPSQTMMPIFSDHPLNEGELADVVAFLGDAPNQDDPDGSVDRLLVTGIVGMIILIGGMAIAWRGMRQTYVEKLRSRR